MFSRTMTRSTLESAKIGPDAGEVLAGPDAGVEVEGLAEVDVDAPEAGADRRRDRGLQGHLGPPARLDDAVGDRGPEPRHDVDARLLDVPIDRDAGGLDAQLRRFRQFRPDAVARDQGHLIGHRAEISREPVRAT